MDDVIRALKGLPVLISLSERQVLAKAEVFKAPDRVLIQIVATGVESEFLAEFLDQAEPIALSFGPSPVQNKIEKRERP